MREQVESAGSYLDLGIEVANRGYQFAFTDIGMFVFIVLSVSILSEVFLRELVKRATLYTSYNRKKEIQLEESLPIFATPVLALTASLLYYSDKGIKTIVTVCALTIVFSTMAQLWIRSKHDKRKSQKYGK